jgi:hypothetical protein
MNAFVIIHFGDKQKYLELEIFFLKNLRENTNNDIIYLYSIVDTPKIFVDIIKKYCNHTIPYDDNNITYNVNFSSYYKHFNLLRVCNFIFAYKLTQYKKICTVESDMMIMKNIDNIFDLNTPSVLIFQEKDKANILENYKLDKNINNYENFDINGGIMLFEPSLEKFNISLKKIKIIAEKNYKYPNETLFLLINDYIYNLPYKYNGTKYQLIVIGQRYNIDIKEYMSIIHLNATEYKYIDIIKDNFLNTLKKKNTILYYFINKYKEIYYDKNYKEVEAILNSI